MNPDFFSFQQSIVAEFAKNSDTHSQKILHLLLRSFGKQIRV